MKIGIITFWESSDNYGQVLQAYALQRVLKDMGHEPFQIRYSLKASSCSVKKQSIIKKFFKALLIYPIFKKIRQRKINRYEDECKLLIEQKNEVRQFRSFRNDYIKQSEIVYNRSATNSSDESDAIELMSHLKKETIPTLKNEVRSLIPESFVTLAKKILR